MKHDYLYWQRVSMSTVNVLLKSLKQTTNQATYQMNKLKRAMHAAKVAHRKARR